MPLRTEYMPLAELAGRKHPENPKDHDLDFLAETMERFGFTDPVLLCERTGSIAAGHGRTETLELLQLNGDAPPRGIDAEGDDWLVPVEFGWSSTDDVELMAYMIADNRAPERGGWFQDVLARQLQMVQAAGSLVGVGYDTGQLAQVLADSGEAARQAAAFLEPVIDPDSPDAHQHGTNADVPVVPALQLVLTFASLEERTEVTMYLREQAARLGVTGVGAALLALVRATRADESQPVAALP